MSRNLVWLGAFGLLTLAAAGAACSAQSSGRTFGNDDDDDDTSTATSGGGGSSSTTLSGGGFNPSTSGSTMAGGNDCATDPAVDNDGDGFSENDGDCNDCDPNVNPAAIDVIITEPDEDGGIPPPSDEDCDGVVDNAPQPCDGALPLDSFDPMDGARAIDICQQASGAKWGVVDAKYVRADGSPAGQSAQVGLLSNFGPNVNVQLGKQMLVLATGTARTPNDPGWCGSYDCYGYGPGTAPPGFPQNAPGCDQGSIINDDVGLELQIKSPKNATGYKYLFKFYSFEFAEYVCTLFNDQYIALVNPPPPGSLNGNISFDSNKNPVSVNIAFFDVCDPNQNNDFAIYCQSGSCPAKPNPYCPSGAGQLAGTGFETNAGEDAGGTSWLQTTAPITGGDTFTIRYAIWDTQDGIYDSSVLIDGFQWIANGGQVTVGTIDVPDPK